ncbi:MAG: glycerol-3-phosphate acyltransferase, partial [Brevinema sp.]
MTHSVFFLIAFLFGSIPCGLLYALARGVDIRKEGSGNIGATNVSRRFGFWQGFMP